ncbi:MAG: hypothetical protein ABI577_11220 [bacterium]
MSHDLWEPGAVPRDLEAPSKLSASPVLDGVELDLEALFDSLRD